MNRKLAGAALLGLAVALTVTVLSVGRPRAAATPGPADEEGFRQARAALVEESIRGWGITDARAIGAVSAVPRHRFVLPEYLDQAYDNHPLPIGHGQTISQPYIVALMTEALALEDGDKVLEIGTGSGYQAAVLAEAGAEVYSIEIILPLAERSTALLRELGYQTVRTRAGDGYYGWPEEAPFEAIIVTAAPDHVPQPLLAQLAVGGVLVIPVGPVGGYQELWRITRLGPDDFETVSLGGVRFVPLVHEPAGFVPED